MVEHTCHTAGCPGAEPMAEHSTDTPPRTVTLSGAEIDWIHELTRGEIEDLDDSGELEPTDLAFYQTLMDKLGVPRADGTVVNPL